MDRPLDEPTPATSDARENYSISISKTDIEKFLNAKQVGIECPFCHTAAWTLISHHELGQPAVPLLPRAGYRMPPASLLLYFLTCDHCGFAAPFNIGHVERWKAETDGK